MQEKLQTLSPTVRPIAQADTAGYRDALDAVARERRYLRLTAAPPLESSERFVASNLERGNPHFIAEIAGRIVGWCDICRSDDASSGHVGFLGMGLIAEYRGRGIGRALLAATLKQASTRFRRVELEVYASNVAAIGLYESAGFDYEGRRRGAINLGSGDEDVLMMARLFTPVR